MGLKTRLDGRSNDNSSLNIMNSKGEVLAEISLLDMQGVTLDISTSAGMYIEKPSGWNSKPKEVSV
jgi:hypothetical protein